MSIDRLQRLHERIAGVRSQLLNHQVYAQVSDLASLRIFMQHHVFAVWDFMSLLKSLQRKVTCINVPWTPRGECCARRLVNEIVLAEESDEDGHGGFASHYEMYRHAMQSCGADTGPIDRFVDRLQAGESVWQSLDQAEIDEPIKEFVRTTFEIIEDSQPAAIAAAFSFGREELLPDLFVKVVADIDAHFNGQAREMKYYLQRHIELDGDDHGPMAMRLVETLCGSEESLWETAERAATQSLEARLALWDGISTAIHSNNAVAAR